MRRDWYLRSRKEARVASTERTTQRVAGSEVRQALRVQPTQDVAGHCKDGSFSLSSRMVLSR